MGYAIPARNSISVGGGISANATTCFHTCSGGACTSIALRTTNTGVSSAAACSKPNAVGITSSTTDSMAEPVFAPQ
jgi:hypothetical protein